jgi:hypothetical protein
MPIGANIAGSGVRHRSDRISNGSQFSLSGVAERSLGNYSFPIDGIRGHQRTRLQVSVSPNTGRSTWARTCMASSRGIDIDGARRRSVSRSCRNS